MDLTCPNCRSDNTQKLSLAVEGGTFTSRGTTVGVGATGKGAGIMAASTKGASTSQLAEKHAAPEKLHPIGAGIGIVIIAWIVSLFAGETAFTIGCFIAGIAAVWGFKYNLKDYPRELAEWNQKFLCLRCSHVFAPQSNASDSDQPLPEAVQ
jgi:hypothetical protein